ncbi:MAG TPA: hypothetical protein VKV28_01300 [Candidatus Binataceae bacterium]|nr:hypothetical protein [Candidatus Binataceae bacterium]
MRLRDGIFSAALASLLAVALAACSGSDSARAQAVPTATPASLAANQTLGFGAGQVLTFTYTMNYDCVDEPTDDLNFNGILAQSDPGEFQTQICQAAIQPTIDPSGASTTQTEPIYVLIPMFSVDNDQNPADAMACPPGVRSTTLCGSALGSTLIKLFGAIPEGFKTKPLVYTQCPTPGEAPGTCTMHSSTVDLGPALVALGKLPAPATNVFVPTPNHSHVIDNTELNDPAIWWEVKPVLVTSPNEWPPADGSTGITSTEELDAAEKAGSAIEVPSNFFLFFSSKTMAGM